MEQAVGEDLHAQVAQRFGFDPAQEVVPLQDLVEQDAVEEAAEREADEVPGSHACVQAARAGLSSTPSWRAIGLRLGSLSTSRMRDGGAGLAKCQLKPA